MTLPPPKVKTPQSKPPQSEDPKVKIVEMDDVGRSGGGFSSGWVTTGLLLVVVFLLGRIGVGFESPAMAEMAINENGYTMMTTDGGSDEILVVIDSRQELLLVYRLGLTGGVDLMEREPLNEVFERARAQALGKP